MKQLLYILILCIGLSCCVHKSEKAIVCNEQKDTVQGAEKIDLDMMQLFCDMGIYAHNMDELKEYGIADIRPIDSIKSFWSIVDSSEYELYFLDSIAYPYNYLEELCLNRLVYTNEEYKKIKGANSYYVFECRFRSEEERDTVINHVLVHYKR